MVVNCLDAVTLIGCDTSELNSKRKKTVKHLQIAIIGTYVTLTERLRNICLEMICKRARGTNTSKLSYNFASSFSHMKHSGGVSKYHPYTNKELSTVSSATKTSQHFLGKGKKPNQSHWRW